MLCIAMRDASPRPFTVSGRTALPTSPALPGAAGFSSRMVGHALSRRSSSLAFLSLFTSFKTRHAAKCRKVSRSSSMCASHHMGDGQCIRRARIS